MSKKIPINIRLNGSKHTYIEILFENDNYLVVNKPAGLPTLSDRQQKEKNLVAIIKQTYNDKAISSPEIRVCHRLDRETSGAIVFAKNKEAHRHLTWQFIKREVYKQYHAVAMGQHVFQEEIARGSIFINSKNYAQLSRRKGKSAKTEFNTLRIFEKCTLLECVPHTGRTHQIRIHAASKNASLVADIKYGGKNIFLSEFKKKFKPKQDHDEPPMIKRVALHSNKISFLDLNGEKIEILAPYPKDFKTLIENLEKFADEKIIQDTKKIR